MDLQINKILISGLTLISWDEHKEPKNSYYIFRIFCGTPYHRLFPPALLSLLHFPLLSTCSLLLESVSSIFLWKERSQNGSTLTQTTLIYPFIPTTGLLSRLQDKGEDWGEADTVKVCGLKIHNRAMVSSAQHHKCVSLWIALLLGLYVCFFNLPWDIKKVNTLTIETKEELVGKIRVHSLWPELTQWRCGRIGPLWLGQLELEQPEWPRFYCCALNSSFNCCFWVCVCIAFCVLWHGSTWLYVFIAVYINSAFDYTVNVSLTILWLNKIIIANNYNYNYNTQHSVAFYSYNCVHIIVIITVVKNLH